MNYLLGLGCNLSKWLGGRGHRTDDLSFVTWTYGRILRHRCLKCGKEWPEKVEIGMV